MKKPEPDIDAFGEASLGWLKLHGKTLDALGPHPAWFWYVLGTVVGRYACYGEILPVEAAFQLIEVTKKFKPKETPTP